MTAKTLPRFASPTMVSGQEAVALMSLIITGSVAMSTTVATATARPAKRKVTSPVIVTSRSSRPAESAASPSLL